MSDNLRNQIHENMNNKETGELVEIWQKHDTEEWTETALDVVREILLARLGELPSQEKPFQEAQDENEGNDHHSVSGLRMDRNIEGLAALLETETDPIVCLEAARALAQLNDERGVEYLTSALSVPDGNVNEKAAEFLEEINHPRMTRAPRLHLENRTSIAKINRDKSLDAQYPYLIAYIGFIALYAALSVVLSFIPLQSLAQLALSVFIGYYIFKFVVQKNVLPYVNIGRPHALRRQSLD
jgi:hypothetical protein